MARSPASADAYTWPIPKLDPWPAEGDRHQVIVIGAGIGGLSAGALLARQGFKVLVLESHDRPGGYCSSWTRKVRRGGDTLTYRFDAGVQDISGIGPRGPLRRLLQRLEIEDRIDWRRVGHHYAKDGIAVTVPAEAGAFAARLAELFPAEAEGLAAFFTEILAVYRELYAGIDETGGVPRAPRSIEAMLAWPATHPHAWRWMKRPFAAMLDEFLGDAALKGLLTTLADYITDQPDRLTVADMAPLFGYYVDGGFYPAGGSQRLADVLAAVIVENGGQVRLRTPVSRIMTENGRVAGVVAAGGVERAPLVMANGDVVSMLVDLLGTEHLPASYADRLGTLQRGPSAIIVSLGVDALPPLPARIFVRHQGLEFGIGNPSVVDTSLAPPGHAALTMLCLLPEDDVRLWRRGTAGYRQQKDAFAERLVAATEATVWPELRRHIVCRQVASPATFARYARTRNGNIYGAARGQWCPGLMAPIPGLMLVGAGTCSGAGIEAVVVSGTIAANTICEAAAAQDDRAIA